MANISEWNKRNQTSHFTPPSLDVHSQTLPPDYFDQLHSQYNVTSLPQLLDKVNNGEVDAAILIAKLYQIHRDLQTELQAFQGSSGEGIMSGKEIEVAPASLAR